MANTLPTKAPDRAEQLIRMTRGGLLLLALVAALAHVGIFLDLPLIWRTGSVLVLTGLLPGILLVNLLIGSAQSLFERCEQALYSIGAGYGVIVVTMLLISYLPGGFDWWQTLLAFDLLLVGLFSLSWWREKNSAIHDRQPSTVNPLWDIKRSIRELSIVGQPSSTLWLITGLIALILIGGFFRFADLSYSEFQGDEARAILRAAEAIQGYDDALLGHKKGPTEILLPTVIYSLTGQINEASARLPFAFANFAALFAIFLLGWRLFGSIAGWVAAILLALDGYFIGFAHIVQYQSIVFLTVVLTVLIFVRLADEETRSAEDKETNRGRLESWLLLAAILLGTGLLSHYEAALVVFPCIYLLWRIGQSLGWIKLLRSLIGPMLVGAGMIGAFYVPFVLNPNFAITYAYITVNRLGVDSASGVNDGAPYNNLVDVFNRTMLYSSSYYVALLVLLAVIGLIMIFWRGWSRPIRMLLTALLLAGLALTLWNPQWLEVGTTDHAWLLFTLFLFVAWFTPRFPWQERTVWIWFGAPMILSLFFTRTPNTHVYGFFMAWALIAGYVIQAGWCWLRERTSAGSASTIAASAAVILVALFGTYAYWYFVHNKQEILRTWETNRPGGYWVPYEMPTNMSIFGFPFRNGWKTIGVLYQSGMLDGGFDTNGRDAVADWYTKGAGYCPRDHRYYIFSQAVEPAEAAGRATLQAELEQEYQLWGTVQVNREDRLHIYERTDQSIEPQHFISEEFEFAFDSELSGAHFLRSGPVAQEQAHRSMGNALGFQFGEQIELVGYTLSDPIVQPGEEVELTLFWRADAPIERPYTVFTQVIDPNDFTKVGQRDGEPVCNRMPTNTWLPGDLIADRYWISIEPDAQPGTYQLLIGMYDRETGDRLPIFLDGNLIGESLGIDEVRVEEASN